MINDLLILVSSEIRGLAHKLESRSSFHLSIWPTGAEHIGIGVKRHQNLALGNTRGTIVKWNC